MVKVITYGTYDLLHRGHIRLLQRAKALGDYLIVAVTADDFDKTRGKLNVQQSLMERIENVRATNLADEIIVEEYEGQKIDDIQRYGVDIFTVGSDWQGKFDYLRDYCQVVYLPRTEGISSSEVRTRVRSLRLGLAGDESTVLRKFHAASQVVNGIEVAGVCSSREDLQELSPLFTQEYDQLLTAVDAVYLVTHPSTHAELIEKALAVGKHVLCESPIAIGAEDCQRLFALAQQKGLVLMDANKVAYSTAYSRLLLLAKSGRIGKVVCVDATCTSLAEHASDRPLSARWSSITEWGPTAMLPVFQLLGTQYAQKSVASVFADRALRFDGFSKLDFIYPNATATVKVGKQVKSEGELIISGTDGYIYVPAPWWKTDYFELRYENPADNKRYFYQLEHEGISYELLSFLRAIRKEQVCLQITPEVSQAVAQVIADVHSGRDLAEVCL